MKHFLLFLALTGMSSGVWAQVDEAASEAAFTKSYEYEQAGNYVKALEALKASNTSSYEYALRAGWLNYMAGQYTNSANLYRAAVKLKPLSIEAMLGLVYPLSALNNWDDVMETYGSILKVDDKNTTANYRLGSILYTRKDYVKAVKYFEKLVNLYPFDYDSVHMLAWTKFRLGQTNDAKALFYRALLIRPADKSAKEGLSLIK